MEPEALDVVGSVLDVPEGVGNVAVDVPGKLEVGPDVEYEPLEEEPVAGAVEEDSMVEGID